MGIKISSGFDLNTARPIDSRLVKSLLTNRDAISPTLRYEGLTIYVKETGRNYQLVGGILNENWTDPSDFTLSSGILEWSGNTFLPYTAKASGVLYSSEDVPTNTSTWLMYDGIFAATQLYDNDTRVSTTDHAHTGTYEPILGTPASNGYLLSSTTGGVRSWINPTSLVTGAALTKTDDTNVTITLSANASTALLKATSITVGWTGKLADARISSAAYWNSKADAGSTISIVGTPLNNQLTAWSSASALKSYPGLTYDGTNLYVTGNVIATGEIAAFVDTDPGPSWWDFMPLATSTTIGGVILDGDISHFLNGEGAWTPAGSIGTTVHSALSNLAYATSGHTGFLPDTHLTDFAHSNIANGQTAFGWGNHAGLYTPIAHNTNTSNPHSVTASQVSLGNVTNESKATMFSSPVFTTSFGFAASKWRIVENGNNIELKFNSILKGYLDDSGNISFVGDVIAFYVP